jgi:hypothetical protein
VLSSYLRQLAQAIRESVPGPFFARIPLGRASRWTPQRVAWVALMMAWDEGQTLDARWRHAREAAGAIHPHWRRGGSYSGFTRALTRLAALAPALAARLRERVREVAGGHWTCGGWAAFAVDGTRIEAPHTAANEGGLGCAGRAKTAPQVFLTTLWHLGTGLPWAYRAGPGTDSERRHMSRMAAELPPRSMLVADAGFPGYPLCRRLILGGHSFVIRVGGNITLIEGLGYHRRERDGLVYLWPARHRRWPPLVLRLIRLTAGPQAVSLLTNVLDPRQLGDAEAASLYQRRWGEEVFHRSYKQTMRRRRLLSRTPGTCEAEAIWTLLGLWLPGLMAVPRIVAAGAAPSDLSVALARDAVRRALRGGRPARGRAPRLGRELAEARKDRCRRLSFKGARNYPRKKTERPPRPPKVRAASPAEVERASGLPPSVISYQWTA